MLRVWVSDWEMGRTGTPFSVGSRVRWRVSAQLDTEWLAMAVGESEAGSVDYLEDPRAAADDGVTITGTVAAIHAIQCRFDVRAGEPGTWPVPGSQQVSPVAYAAHWVPDEPPRRFVGWMVDLTLHYVIPADPVGPPC